MFVIYMTYTMHEKEGG